MLIFSSNDEKKAKEHILKIQEDYIKRRDRVSDSLIGALEIIKWTFSHMGHFLLEFIQNAEDAKATRIKIVLKHRYVRIMNNGDPFSREDVESICGVGESRKDPKEYIGYLGVGFKSVFLISTCPHIYSKPYRFKFDRDHWHDPKKIPWQLTPIWLNDKIKELDEWNVVFHIPIDENTYNSIKNELEELTPTTLLFLHNLREIELEYEDKKIVIKKNTEEKNIYVLEVLKNGVREVSRWLIFRKIVKIPENIKSHRLTIEWKRDQVEKREIAVAFKLNEEGDLISVRGTVKFGVFSYLPIKEAGTGLPFLIHADFLVGPGREIILRDAQWNKWMLDELADFIINYVIREFKSHEKWKYSYMSILYSEGGHSLIDDRLTKPINEELEKGKHIVDIRGKFIEISEAIKVDDYVLEHINIELIEKITNKKILHPKAELPFKFYEAVYWIKNLRDLYIYLKDLNRIKSIFGDEWINCYKNYLVALSRDWFTYAESTRRKYRPKYLNQTALVDDTGNICTPNDLYISVNDEVEEIVKRQYPNTYKFLHPDLRDKEIISYLKDLGIKMFTADDLNKLLIRDNIPKLLDELEASDVSDERKIEIVKTIKEYYDDKRIINLSDIPKNRFLVKTKSGKWLKPGSVLFSSEYNPSEDIEKLVRKGLLDKDLLEQDLEFLDPIFIENATYEEKLKWIHFFKELGVGRILDEKKNILVERVGILTSLKYEREVCGVKDVRALSESERYKGYDIESKMRDGSPKYIEVKSSRGESDITLSKTEYMHILRNPRSSYIYVVTNALSNPELNIIGGWSLEDTVYGITLRDWKSRVSKKWRPLD